MKTVRPYVPHGSIRSLQMRAINASLGLRIQTIAMLERTNMSKLALDRFLAEEKLYLNRDGNFSGLLCKILSAIETRTEEINFESNDIEFLLSHAQELISVRFLYGDPSKVKTLQFPYQDFVRTIDELKSTSL